MSAVDSPTDSFAAFHPELSPARRWAILVCFVLAAAIAIMSQLTMTTCLPSITSEFAIDTAQGQWLTTSYMLTMGIMIPCTGFLMTRFQSRHLFLAANAVFFVGILGTFAQSFGALVAVRCVQGLAGGLFIPLMQVIAFRLFPPHQRGFAMGIAAVALAAGPVLGPIVAGVCTDLWGWRSVFAVVAGCTVLSLLSYPVVGALIEKTGEASFDVVSLVLIAVAFIGLIVGAGSLGTSLPRALLLLAVGACFLWLFARRQSKVDHPLLSPLPMRNRSFVLGIAAVTTVFGVLINIETFMSIYIQNDQGFSPTMAALCLMPGAVLSAVIAPFTGRVLDRRGPLGLSVCGFSCLVMSGILACLVVPTTPLWYSLAVFMVRAVGNACVMQNLQTWAVNCLSSELITHGTSIATTARQVGGAFINTVLFALMGALVASGMTELEGIRIATALSTVCVAAMGIAVVFGLACGRGRANRPDL